jgi:hypothetical protein
LAKSSRPVLSETESRARAMGMSGREKRWEGLLRMESRPCNPDLGVKRGG